MRLAIWFEEEAKHTREKMRKLESKHNNLTQDADWPGEVEDDFSDEDEVYAWEDEDE